MLPPEFAIDLDLEPLEPFMDDVFAGMDEHPAGPWPHHTWDPTVGAPTGQLHQQAQDTHFPAIDCNLLEEQPHADHAADSVLHQEGSSFVRQPAAHLSTTVTAGVQDGEAPRPVQDATALPEAPAELYELQACPASSSTAAAGVQDLQATCHAADAAQAHAAGMASSSCSVEHNQQQYSEHDDSHQRQQQQQQLEEGQQAKAVAGTLQEQAVPAAGPASGWGCLGADSSSEGPTSGASSSSSTEVTAAGAANASTEAGASAAPACAAQAAALCVDSSSLGGAASADGTPAAAAYSAAGRSNSSGDDAGPGSGASATADATQEDAADSLAAAASGPEPSSGSLPDIDDVPEQEDVQQQQQQRELHIFGPAAEVALQQQQQQPDGLPGYELGTAAQQPAVGDSMQQQSDPHSALTASAADQHAGSAAGQQQDAASSKDSSHLAADCAGAAGNSGAEKAQATVVLVAADADVSDCHAALAQEQQQLQRQGSDDFASPCSSWHSCVTAASKASSMNSSRGFFLQPPAAAVSAGVAAAAALVAASSSQEGAGKEATFSAQQQQASGSGVSSPAMVSSLHLALQQQQQQRSQHSDQLTASVTLQDPLSAGGAGSVSSLAAGIAELDPSAATAVADAAAEAAASCSEGDSSDDRGEGSSSQPIAVQCAHEHYQRQQQERREEDPWQSVSPPSFTSSPGLLVSAVAARAAAAQDATAAAAGGGTSVAAQADDGLGGSATAAAGEGQQQQEEDAAEADAEDGDIGHGCFYADSAGLSMSPEQGGLMYPPGLHHPAHQHMAASSYMLRQSELVDLSLSTSMHPSQMQRMQQHPGWLTAHQQLPPAAAQAVERAVVALNDSYCYPGRGGQSPSEVFGSAAAAGAPSGRAGGARAMGVAAMGAVGGAIRRSGAGVQWNRAHTQPQQDQQARHRLPSPTSGAGPAGTFGWPGAAVLGDWFSSTVQQPLAAVASRAAVGVGQRLGMAPGQNQPAAAFARQHSISRPPAQAGAPSTGAAVRSGSPGSMGQDYPAAPASSSARMAPAGAGAVSSVTDGRSGPAGLAAEDSLDDAVMVEKTSDLPQSLQEQEDEAFRGLLFLGGRDSQGRPVVIINTDAIPAGHNSAPRDAALAYLLKRLSPVVTRGPYVLVIVALHHGPQFRLLPGVWCVRAYQSLPRAFRKHVKHVILLQPSMLVKAAVTLLYPFVSSKAHAKVKQVQRLLDIDAATRGEVQVPHLGEAFLTTIHHINRSRAREADSSSA